MVVIKLRSDKEAKKRLLSNIGSKKALQWNYIYCAGRKSSPRTMPHPVKIRFLPEKAFLTFRLYYPILTRSGAAGC